MSSGHQPNPQTEPNWAVVASELSSAARAVARPAGASLLPDLLVDLCMLLQVPMAFVGIADVEAGWLDVLVARLDDAPLKPFRETLDAWDGADGLFRHLNRREHVKFGEGSHAALNTMESLAIVALRGGSGRELGLLAVADRNPRSDDSRLEALLAMFGSRVAIDIESRRIDDASLRIADRESPLEELRLREEQYRVIFEASSDGFILRDGNLRTLDANPAFYRMYGFDREKIAAGGGYPPEFPRDYVAEREAQVRRALDGHETHVETVALRADGSAFWIDLRVIPVQYRGQPHVLQVVRDISALREREGALQRSEARLRATVEAGFDAIVGMDEQGRIVEFNSAAQRCFGYSRCDVLGRPLAELIIPHRHRVAHQRGLEQFRESGIGPFIGRLIETTALRRDGSEFPVELAISVGKTAEESIFVGHIRDITARNEAAERRTELESQLRQAQKMEAMGQLTGGIAHDFNNILASVIGYVVMAAERAEPLQDERLVRQLQNAHLAAQRARDLVAQMLAFSRRGGKQHQNILLAPTLRQSLLLLRSTLPSSIEVVIEFANDAVVVNADAVQLEQVLLNLCINARDAMQGVGRLQVGLAQHQRGGYCASCRGPITGHWVEFTVMDDGPGIAPEVQARMFDPFFTTKEIGRGSGMGLAMVHGIVHAHGGHIVVDSAPGSGSVFSVLLPVGQGTAGQATAVDGLPGLEPVVLQGHILLVDDDVMVATYLADRLEQWGLQVTSCRDPLDARDRFEMDPHRFDLVITDQTMPGMAGTALLRTLLAIRPELPTILCTGFGEGLDHEISALGVKALLAKPFDQDKLLALLRVYL